MPGSNIVVIELEKTNALKERPLLSGLMVVGAGYSMGQNTPQLSGREVPGRALLLYCAKGRGWCEAAGRLRKIEKGDVLIVPPDSTCTCGSQASAPWNVHWVELIGNLLTDYLNELGLEDEAKVIQLGEDLQLPRLLTEILRALQRGTGVTEVLHASQALAHLLAVIIEKSHGTSAPDRGTTEKVAEAIIYMGEHLAEPVRISTLARLVSLSPTYFTGLFKQQTGCSPRDYLHLLRIHRACRLLRETELSIKQISSEVGYLDQFHFSRRFKAFQGVSPSQYRVKVLVC